MDKEPPPLTHLTPLFVWWTDWTKSRKYNRCKSRSLLQVMTSQFATLTVIPILTRGLSITCTLAQLSRPH